MKISIMYLDVLKNVPTKNLLISIAYAAEIKDNRGK